MRKINSIFIAALVTALGACGNAGTALHVQPVHLTREGLVVDLRGELTRL